ncbi:PEP/pyruvate-binding domain-containing protein [Yoonia algicola]|uniref:PEP/pyruvate-binding domain-containing protein n=1 Tax=Yoonia algicola TaxID=3137368 RepID=A0AAN0MHB7_9RHOB
MSALIYSFDTDQRPTLAEVGGKALSLIATTKAGLPVPDGLALSVAFFAPWTEAIKVTPEWQALLDAPTKEACDRVKALAAQMTLTDAQTEALIGHLDLFASGGTFAVRSSSPEEDLAGASFAGMYETFLGTTRDQIEDVVAKAYASMFDIHVMSYKVRQGIALEGTAISVIVQRQIASDVSGVGFSLNPMNNCYDEAVIDAGFGLGEAIVSGIVTPDHYVVDKVSMEIIDKRISEKAVALHLNPDGGMTKGAPTDPQAQALTEGQILELTGLIKDTEDHYGFPVDIEWAYENDRLFLLQARPITTYFPLFPEMITAPGTRKKLYMDTFGLTQGFNERLSILGADIWAIVLDRLKRGGMPAGPEGYLLNLHGRQYFQLHNMMKGLGKRALDLFNSYDNALEGREAELLRDYKAQTMSPQMKQARRAQISMVGKMLPHTIRLLWDPIRFAKGTEASVEGLLDKFRAMENDRPFDALVEDAFTAFDAIFFDFLAYMAGFLGEWRIRRMMRGTEGEALKMFLVMDVPSNPTSAMGHAMLALAGFPDIRATLDAADFETKIRERSYAPEFMEAFDAYIDRYGARGFREIDIATPRVMERLGDFFQQLKAINLDDNQMLHAHTRKADAIAKMREIAKSKGKLKAFDKNLRTIEVTYGHRETPKYLVVMMNGALRRVALEIGAEFVAQGRLDAAGDIFELSIAQVAQAQTDETLALRPLIATNLKPMEIVAGVKDYPNFIDSRGKIFRKHIEAGSGDLAGMAVSHGTYTGRAKVLKTPYEKRLEPGDILVTVATEPSWTPVFVNASAVVLEVGGGLQHGAIIAREYGLPCVSGLPGVTGIIKDGDLLEVDGTNGIVKILETAA